jgi:quercetin dioxygenase-like cupin family protein
MIGAHTGSTYRSINKLVLEPADCTVQLSHAMEAVYVIAEGRGSLVTGGERHHLRPFSIVYLPPRVVYTFNAETDMTIYGGPCPPDPDPSSTTLPDGRADTAEGTARVLDAENDGPRLPMISRNARLVVWPGMGAEIASMNFVVLEPGEENDPHTHEKSDDTIVILEGSGSIEDLSSQKVHQFQASDVVHVRAGIPHCVRADHGVRIVSAGGPCPPDQAMLKASGLLA